MKKAKKYESVVLVLNGKDNLGPAWAKPKFSRWQGKVSMQRSGDQHTIIFLRRTHLSFKA
jgi:hypothetical protein